MTGTHILLTVFGVAVQFCIVLGRHDFYEYYYSRYHRGHSSTSTESIIIPSTSGFIPPSSEYEGRSTQSDDTSQPNQMYEPTVYPFDENYVTNYDALRIGITVAGAVIFVCVFCCLICCIRHCCTRKERRGFVIGSQAEMAREVVPQQHVLMHQPPECQRSCPVQSYDERNHQFFPPQYQPQPMQQFPPMQFQYSPPPMQSHNPPEAPPPYDFPHKF